MGFDSLTGGGGLSTSSGVDGNDSFDNGFTYKSGDQQASKNNNDLLIVGLFLFSLLVIKVMR